MPAASSTKPSIIRSEWHRPNDLTHLPRSDNAFECHVCLLSRLKGGEATFNLYGVEVGATKALTRIRTSCAEQQSAASHNAALHRIEVVERLVGVAKTSLFTPAFQQPVRAKRQFIRDQTRDQVDGGPLARLAPGASRFPKRRPSRSWRKRV
jgi:hypothetical protein